MLGSVAFGDNLNEWTKEEQIKWYDELMEVLAKNENPAPPLTDEEFFARQDAIIDELNAECGFDET
ncbi:MAG: hypothetical protein KME29_04755 [Calothrix sp. FI2-JRJ7]|jgi:hypothetical protein|nr:hypothetical protein [Calothrix sp. FI2-JRJ7]